MSTKKHPIIALPSWPNVLVTFHVPDRNRDFTPIIQLYRDVRDGRIDDLVLEISGKVERLIAIDKFGAGAGRRMPGWGEWAISR